ncbi:calcium-binding protein [Singulisphaera sp. PoT]|uniref:calcium-binding protein n=1 Tax=Singulisphaera sp. PoT TaxID=3411797 RepID=UPI003BF4A430
MKLPRRKSAYRLPTSTSRSHAAKRGRKIGLIELLESRVVLSTIDWTNRGVSDNFDLYGANEDTARQIVDTAIDLWEQVIDNFNYANSGGINEPVADNTYEIEISAFDFSTLDPPQNLNGRTFDLQADIFGKPYAAKIELNSDISNWYFDANPDTDDEFDNLLTPFAGYFDGTSANDFLRTTLHELGHAMGIAGSILFDQTTDTGFSDPVASLDDPGVLRLFDQRFVRAAFTDVGGSHTYEGPRVADLPILPYDLMNAGRATNDPPVGSDAVLRKLISDIDATILQLAFGYTINAPSTIRTMQHNFVEDAQTRVVVATGGNDTIIVKLADDDTKISVRVNGTETLFDLATSSGLVIRGLAGNDTIHIDQFLGIPIAVDGDEGNDTLNVLYDADLDGTEIFYNGGADFDSLHLQGGDGLEGTYNVGPASDAGSVLYSDGGSQVSIFFSGLEPIIDDVVAANLTVAGTAAENEIHYLASNLIGHGRVQVDDFERIDFKNKTTLTLNGLGGGDSFLLDNFATPFGLTGIVINGGAGDDSIQGANSSVPLTIDGGDDDDTIVGSRFGDFINGGAGVDTIDGGDGSDTIDGGSNSDTINGGAGADTIFSNSGDDVIDGGTGQDRLIVSGSLFADDITLASNGVGLEVTILGGVLATLDVTDVEGVELLLDTGADVVTIEDLSSTAVTHVGIGLGDDLIDLDEVNVLARDVADDLAVSAITPDLARLTGLSYTVEVSGFDTDDIFGVSALGGDDVLLATGVAGLLAVRLFGDDGEDTLRGEADRLDGGDGDDVFEEARGNLIGGAGDDLFFIGAGVDQNSVDGGPGFNQIVVRGHDGANTIAVTQALNIVTIAVDGAQSVSQVANITRILVEGLDGDDTITLTALAIEARVDAGDGDDSVDGSATTVVSLLILGGLGDDTLIGGGLADRIEGGDGDDTITGNGGDDDLFGGADSDAFIRGAGDGEDVVEGGTGLDSLTFSGLPAASNSFFLLSDGNRAVAVLGAGSADTADVEQISLIGGSAGDLFTIDSLTTTDVTLVDVDLGVGGTQDIVIVNGSSAADKVGVAPSNTADVEVAGLSALVRLFNTSDQDWLNVRGNGGSDEIEVDPDVLPLISVQLDGGSGNDILSGATRILGGVGNDTLTGTEFADTILGGQGADTILGLGGSDLLLGDAVGTGVGSSPLLTPIFQILNPDPAGGAADDIHGGEGDDTINGGAGGDTLKGGAGNDTIGIVNVPGVGLFSEPGNDLIYGDGVEEDATDGNDLINSGDGNDKVHAGGGNDEVHGGLGNDEIDGDSGNDLLFGDDGNDRVSGGDGADEIHGGVGDDHLEGGSGNDNIFGEQGADTILGGHGDDTIDGGDDADQIFGEDGNDAILGGAGNDRIEGGAGNDVAYGGLGEDTILGNGGNDVLNGEQGNDRLEGGDGNDALYGEDGNDTILGGAGIDVARGGEGDDSIDGGADNDFLDGGNGVDTIRGGTGNDAIDGGSGADHLFGDDGNDSILGGTGADGIEGGAGDDLIFGGDDDDTILGGTGNDKIIGEQGNDKIDAGDGDDLITGGPGNDLIYGGAGSDVAFGGVGADTIDGGPGVDFLFGGDGNDILRGRDGNDWLFGQAGDDLLEGGFGDDLLVGGVGNDRLHGGNGVFREVHQPDPANEADGNDVLLGGDGFDVLDGGNGNNVLDAGDDVYRETVLAGSGNDIGFNHFNRGEGPNGASDVLVLDGGTNVKHHYGALQDPVPIPDEPPYPSAGLNVFTVSTAAIATGPDLISGIGRPTATFIGEGLPSSIALPKNSLVQPFRLSSSARQRNFTTPRFRGNRTRAWDAFRPRAAARPAQLFNGGISQG